PCCRSSSLVLLNGRDPKNPFRADNGLGCTDSMHGTVPNNGFRLFALLPHRTATIGSSRAASARIACSVISSHPLPWCEFGSPGRTVSDRFNNNTPCSVHGVRSPVDGSGCPRSATYSL